MSRSGCASHVHVTTSFTHVYAVPRRRGAGIEWPTARRLAIAVSEGGEHQLRLNSISGGARDWKL